MFLKELHLDRNLFRRVPRDSMKYLFHLVTLNLSQNSIHDLSDSSFDNVINVRHLDVSSNTMKSVSERAFHNVTKLESLDLGHNWLEAFPTSTFLPLANLRSLTANDNLLPFVSVAVQALRSVKELRLDGNTMGRLKEVPVNHNIFQCFKIYRCFFRYLGATTRAI